MSEGQLALLARIKESNLILNGSLAPVNNWTYFTDNPSKDLEHLTATGPYAGTLDAFTTGVRFRTRYEHLLPNGSSTRLWASDSERVIQTARYFSSGLFGLDWETDGAAELQVIPETPDRRADTLTPGDTCLRYVDDTEQGHDKGVNMLSRFHETYIPAIADRLSAKEQNPNIRFSNLEIFSMQEMCGFETMTRGSSPWCDVFSEEDWDNFEYARDLIHYYRAGPGNPYAGAMGWLWLNATTTLLRRGPGAGTMFFSL
jgi:acid phosphatase